MINKWNRVYCCYIIYMKQSHKIYKTNKITLQQNTKLYKKSTLNYNFINKQSKNEL